MFNMKAANYPQQAGIREINYYEGDRQDERKMPSMECSSKEDGQVQSMRQEHV
jgi:hypothetical protein